jgi:tetratricopeptide (TPR) repeat protein
MMPVQCSRLIDCALAIALLLMVASCGEAKRELSPVPVPDTTTFEPGVRARLGAARAEFDRVAAGRPTDEQLGSAYGKLAMSYHAQGVTEPATVAYINAHALAPHDKRWPYLLAQLYADGSKIPEAIAAFQTALDIDPTDAATQIFLGRLYLKEGLPDQARPFFEKAQSKSEARAAALTGLGKAALAQGSYREAANNFEEALKLAPAATRLRQPLAVAYRGLGETAKAEENLKQYEVAGFEPGVPDPVFDELYDKAAAYRALLARAQGAARAGRLDLAEQAFRQAVEDNPENADAVANLGITLANLGRIDEAQQRLKQAVTLDDTKATTHLSLGMVFDRQGLDQLAIDEYAAASSRDPANLQARVYRADAKMRIGDPQEAARLYREALDKSPGSTRLQLSLAMALVKAGQFGEARDVLETAHKAQPEDPDIGNSLARLLATAAKDSVRDGARALQLAKALYGSTHRNPIVGQTYAMALAETGDFGGAVKLQRDAIAALQKQGAASADPFATRNLALYRQRMPAREGWSPDDPLLKPRSPAARLAGKPAAPS